MPLFCADRHKKPAFYARTPPRPPLQTGRTKPMPCPARRIIKNISRRVDEEIFVQESAEPNLFDLCRAQPKITK